MPRLRTLLALVLVAAILPTSVHACLWHSKSPSRALDGAWRLVGTLSGPGGALVTNASGFEQYKLVSDGRFMWTSVQDGKVFRTGGGVAHVGKGTYTERLDYTAPDALAPYLGRTHEFKWKLVDGRWYHTGTLHGDNGEEFHVGEVWERAKAE